MTPYYMRGSRKKQIVAGGLHILGTDADRSASMAGTRGRAVARLETKDDPDAAVSRKRKRGLNPFESEDDTNDQLNPNDITTEPDSNFPKLDGAEISKLSEVIEQQFSLEILLKNQERRAIEAEKAKVEISLKQLELCVAAGDATYQENPSRFHNYYNQYVDYGVRSVLQHNGNTIPAPSSSRPQRNAAMKAAARNNSSGHICLAKNDQGKVVRVTCPDCHRYDFSNVQGFINHCRIAHKLEFASHDDAVRHCGVEVDFVDIDAEDSARPTRPSVQSILNTSSTLSGKLPETARDSTRKVSSTSFDDEYSAEFNVAFNEYVASPVTTRARAQSFNSMFTSGELSNALMAGYNGQGFPQPTIHTVRRNSLPSQSRKDTAKSKRSGGSRVSSRRTTSNGMPSPAETDTIPTLKHLNKFVRSSSIEYDIDGFVEEMRREKHNNMLLAAEEDFLSGDSEDEEKPDAKKPNAGVRRPAGSSRKPANWAPPVAGLVEVPATRLRNRQQKEKERLLNEAKVEADLPSTTVLEQTLNPHPKIEQDDVVDIVTSEPSTAAGRGHGLTNRKKQSPATRLRASSTKPLKKSPMEEQAFLSTLPLRIKNRRRRISTTAPKSDNNEKAIQLNPDEREHDSDATSSDDELGKLRKAKGVDGTMTPTSHSTATGFVGLSCGKDAPNVHFVSPTKESPEIFARPDLVDGSRYYVKRRIKIGNSSRYIPESKRSPRMAKYTHKWMIYFVSPPYSAPISTFLSTVTIFLDESFPLPRVIELRVPPFRWVSYGWGEFNLHIRLAFCDPAKNKPMDVVHPLKLDPGKSGREVTGYEGYFDVELDRASEFLPGEPGVEYDEVPRMADVERADSQGQKKLSKKAKSSKEEMGVDMIRIAEIRETASATALDMSTTEGPYGSNLVEHHSTLIKNAHHSDEIVVEGVSEIDDVEIRQIVEAIEPYAGQLRDAVKKYPLISETAKLPYSVALSKRVFLSWNIGRQKSVEWHRARLVQAEVLSKLPDDNLNNTADLTVKAIVVWCRQNQLGPPTRLDADDEELQYCRYCGMISDPPPRKGQKRSKSSWGVDAYCRCGHDITASLASIKTSSTVKDIIDRNQNGVDHTPFQNNTSLSPHQKRALLFDTDVTMVRWVWNTVQQLELPSTQPDSEDFQKWADETLTASAVLSHATRSFLARLIRLIRQQPSATEPEDEDEVIVVGGKTKVHDQQTPAAPLVVTPIHVLQAIRAGREFDFLTNAGMATGSSQVGGEE